MDRSITFKSKPMSLAGRKIREGIYAPPFSATDININEVRLSDYKDSIKIITSFLSLDTSVCDMQVKEFNKRAVQLSGGVVIIGISQDLPFAQRRFCQSNAIDKVITLSDYKTSSFAINYGLLIKELHLVARSVIIIDKNNVIRYVQIVQEQTDAPDYEAALKALETVIQSPQASPPLEMPSRCLPCETGMQPLTAGRVEKLMAGIKGWELVEDKKIKKSFKFKDFVETKYFVDMLGVIAEEQGHHPNINIIYDKIIVTLTTHAIGGLSENDFLMARIFDELGG